MTDLPQAPATDKEKERGSIKEEAPRRVPIVETRVPKEVWQEAVEAGHLEKIEKDAELTKPITHKGQVLVTAPSAQKPKIVLPVSKQTYLDPKSWHLPVTAALRWLLTWIRRIMKMYPEETVFQDESAS